MTYHNGSIPLLFNYEGCEEKAQAFYRVYSSSCLHGGVVCVLLQESVLFYGHHPSDS